jgi:taurine dioxygenase
MNQRVNPSVARPVLSERAGITIRRTGVNLGAEISGVDLRHPLPDAQFSAIESALVENELIIFRDQDISSDQLMAFGRRFGELTVHPFAPNEGKNVPELIKFRNDETTPPFGTDVWHSDETFRAEPPMATILRATDELPAVGGDTMFASMAAAYDGLSDRMQQYISGLHAIHDMKPFRPLFGQSLEDRKKLQQFELMYPPQLHPVVRIHPVSGRKVLFVNPQFTLYIKGMAEDESRAVLDLLFSKTKIHEYQYRHRWRPNMVIFWDNRGVQHSALHDYYPKRRLMERVTIQGTRPLAAEPAADAKDLRRYLMPPLSQFKATAQKRHHELQE